MIEAGKNFCPWCGGIYTEAFYKESTHSTGAILKRNLMSTKYALVPKAPFGTTVDPDEVVLEEQPDKDYDGLPTLIRARFKDDSTHVNMKRHCPLCAAGTTGASDHEAFPDCGKYPLYVIAMVGDKHAGKSAWLDALAYPQNYDAVNRENYPYRLDLHRVSPRFKRSESTPVYGRGQTKLLTVTNKQDNRIVAQVLLMDMSGELYRDPNGHSLIWNFLCKGGQYPGADAFVFVEPIGTGADEDAVVLDEDCAISIYGHCKEVNAFGKAPVAYVMTHLDEAIESGAFPEVYETRGMARVGLMNQDTFLSGTSYERGKLIPRIKIEHVVARSYNPPMLLGPENARGFLVQSCKTVNDPTHGNVEDRKYGINVMDPLIWILNELNLFPIE